MKALGLFYPGRVAVNASFGVVEWHKAEFDGRAAEPWWGVSAAPIKSSKSG